MMVEISSARAARVNPLCPSHAGASWWTRGYLRVEQQAFSLLTDPCEAPSRGASHTLRDEIKSTASLGRWRIVAAETAVSLDDRAPCPPRRSRLLGILSFRPPQVLWQFLPLGVIAYGGPNAHIALLHERFVDRSKWLTEEQFVELMAVGQGLPGPTSTQVGMTPLHPPPRSPSVVAL